MKKHLLLGSLIAALATNAAHAAQPVGIALISAETDVSERHIAPFMATDFVPGFPGAHGGWNFADDNAQLMSESSRKLVKEHGPQINRIYELADQYGATGNWNAFDAQVAKEGLKEIDDNLGYLGFGTQSASIVTRFSKGADVSLNVLVFPDGDKETKADILLKRLDETTVVGKTVFDNETTAQKYAEYLTVSAGLPWLDRVNQYIKYSGVKIVKSESALPRSMIRAEINKKFGEHKVPSIEQQKNMDMVYSLVSERMESAWCALPRDNPTVLFMFPAGHSGTYKDSGLLAGNADADETLPVSCERSYQNVLSSTSVNDDGSLVASSDYGVSIDIAGVMKQPGFLPTGKQFMTGGTCAIGNALTGVAAAIWSEHPNYTPGEVKAAILKLGSPLASLKSKVATASYITRETLSHYDRFAGKELAKNSDVLPTTGTN